MRLEPIHHPLSMYTNKLPHCSTGTLPWQPHSKSFTELCLKREDKEVGGMNADQWWGCVSGLVKFFPPAQTVYPFGHFCFSTCVLDMSLFPFGWQPLFMQNAGSQFGGRWDTHTCTNNHTQIAAHRGGCLWVQGGRAEKPRHLTWFLHRPTPEAFIMRCTHTHTHTHIQTHTHTPAMLGRLLKENSQYIYTRYTHHMDN